MAYTDKNGKVWPDRLSEGGVNLILDPVASLKAGRPKYRPDPKQQQEYAYNNGFAERPAEPTGPLEGLAMVGAGTAAAVGGQQLGSYLGGQFGSDTAKAGLSEVGKQVLTNQGGQAAGQSLANLSGAGAPTGVQTLANGSTLMSDGTVVAAQTPGMFSLSNIGASGNAILPAAGALGLYNLYSSNLGATNRPAGVAQGAASGAAMGSYFGPWGTAIGAGLGGIYGATQHESTADAQKRRWGGLSEAAQGLYSANHPENDDGVWDTGKYAGQEWTFEKAADLAKDDPTHFQGVYGNVSALGDKYFALNDAQQKEFVKQNLASGNYASNKGDVILQDHNLANQIYSKILASQQKPANAQQNLAIAGVKQEQKKEDWMR